MIDLLGFVSNFCVTWNATHEAEPAGTDDPAEGDDRIRELKSEVRQRADQEHNWFNTTSAGETYHKEGSARGYYTGTEPTVRPDGSTALGSNDDGRYWTDSGTDNITKVWSGTAFANIATYIPAYSLILGTGINLTEGSWTKFASVTEVDTNITGASVSSGVITLTAGTYLIFVHAPIKINLTDDGSTMYCNIRWQNTSDASTTYESPAWHSANDGATNVIYTATLTGIFTETITSSKDFELQYNVGASAHASYASQGGTIMILRIA